MPNKRREKKKLSFKGVVQAGLATILASTMGLTCGAAFTALNSDNNVSAYLRDGNPLEETRTMMNADNYLMDGYWMNVILSPRNNFPITYDVNLSFTIPGYDMKNLSFVIKDRNSGNVGEYQVSGDAGTISLPNLAQSTYDVSVYDGKSADGKFVCKAEFYVVSQFGFSENATTNILDGSGNPIVLGGQQQKLVYYKPTEAAGNYMVQFELPYGLIPYNTHTVKIVFFESEADRGGEPVNITQSLYDYAWRLHQYAGDGSFHYYTKIGTGSGSKTYEAHFYKDEVKAENFICKAVGIVLP